MTKTEGGGDGDTKVAPTIESLGEQIENLNKGIAKYRDDASKSAKEVAEAKADAKAAREEAAAVKKAIDEAKDDPEDKELKLSPTDQKKLEAWAKAQGFTTKDEFEKEKQRVYGESLKSLETQAVNEFLEKYPELNSDEEWKKIGDQFALYKQPTTLAGYRQVLTKIYKEIHGSEDTAAKARAQIENRKRLALGGGNQKADADEAQLDEYAERYPNLSRDQISARVKEINELAEARAKRKAGKK